jgi:oligoribonuclease (3'-5' exoribonuclease)
MYFARPNPITGIPDPVRNDKNFIVKAYPTLTKDNLFYQTGNMFTVKKIIVRVHTIAGQQLIRKETSYTNGSLDISKLSKGAYILTITSDDYKQQFVQQFVKE